MTIPTIMLAAALQTIVVVLLFAAAAIVSGIATFFYLRAKNREAIDPALSAGEPLSSNGLGEMRELTSRIEDIVLQQQDTGETQRQHLSRKIDSVKESVESQHHAVTGLRQELRHEVSRRDAEIHDIRSQIEAVREGVGLPPAQQTALPPAQDLGAPEAEGPLMPLAFAEDINVDDLAFSPFEDVTFASEDAAPAGTPGEESLFAPQGFAFEEDTPSSLFEASPEEMEATASPLAFEELVPEMPDPLSFAEMDAPFAQDASPMTFETEDEPSGDSTAEPSPFSFGENMPEVSESPIVFEESGIMSLNDPDPLGFEEVSPLMFEEATPASDAEQAPLAEETTPELDEIAPLAFEESTPFLDVDPTPQAFDMSTLAFSTAPEASQFASEEPEEDAPTQTEEAAPAFEEQTPLAAEAPTAPVVEAPAPLNFDDDDAPVTFNISFDDSEPLTFEAAELSSPEMTHTAETPLASEGGTEEAPAPTGAFEIVSFIAPETDQAAAMEAEPVEQAVGALAFQTEEHEVAAAPAAMYASHDARTDAADTLPEHEAPVDFEPSIEMEDEAQPTAWISRPEREGTPETIGGIVIEQVGDVPTAPPSFTEEPEAYAEALPQAEEEDTFPEPVIANDLVEETSFDFGIDIDDEIAFGEQHGASVENDPSDLVTAPMEELTFAPEAAMPDLAPAIPDEHPAMAPVYAASEPQPPAPEAIAPEVAMPEMADMEMAEPEAFTADSLSTEMPVPVEPAAEAVEAYEPPEGAEDLTAITSVDEDMQRELYKAGVLTLDEIARWGRTEARRISSEVGISEQTIMQQWVFEAQAALFDRFSR